MSTHSLESKFRVFRATSDVIGKCNAQRFAPEILSMIFAEVIALDERDPIITIPTTPSSESEDNEFSTKPLLALSHVCSYWREVAVGNPALWRHIHGQCHNQMQVFLERSQSLTVTLFLSVVHWSAPEDGPMPAPMASVVRTQAERLRRLDLRIVPARQNITPLLGSLQARHLEVLTMTSSCMYHTSSAGSAMTRELLLNGETTSLKALAITPAVNWIPSTTPFPHLTHLFIAFDAAPGLIHSYDVLRLLSNTPTLLFLHVDALIYDTPYLDSWRPPAGGVSLRQLRSLVFTMCSYYLMLSILSCLVLPEDISIRLQGMIHDVDSEGYPVPLPPMALHPVTFLDISTDQDQFRMVADGRTSGVWLDALYKSADVPDPSGWETWLLRLLPQSISLSHITHLHIHLARLSVFLPGLLGHLPQVSRLAVLFGQPMASSAVDADQSHVQDNVSIQIAVLSRTLSPTTAPAASANISIATAPGIRCPVLQTLLIEWQDTVALESARALPSFAAMLTDRAHAGYPIRRVVLQAPPRRNSEGAVGAVTVLDVFRRFESAFSSGETECEVVQREEGTAGICSFEMRSVWKVEGEEKYWELGGYEKPGYGVRGQHNW